MTNAINADNNGCALFGMRQMTTSNVDSHFQVLARLIVRRVTQASKREWTENSGVKSQCSHVLQLKVSYDRM